jgi:hypothetical protein
MPDREGVVTDVCHTESGLEEMGDRHRACWDR